MKIQIYSKVKNLIFKKILYKKIINIKIKTSLMLKITL